MYDLSVSVTAIGARSGRQRVLICNDERHIARLLQVNLERQGHIVVCAFDGGEAVERLSEADGLSLPLFDRVVVDIMMPIREGYEVLKWIRSHDHTNNLWVALMVSRLPDDDLSERIRYHPDKYLLKPFNPLEVLS